MTDNSNGVVFDSVSKSFGTHTVLNNLNLSLAPGELVTVLGPSGCGKTTALRVLAGFERPTSGRILIDGKDVTAVPANKRGIGMVFQAYSLFPNLSVLDNVEYGLRIRRVDRGERRRRAQELLELCGLGPFGERFPHQLSGGQQQRVALARALAVQPSVLLLDEPLSALDAAVRTQIRDEIQRLQRELGITTLFVTHDQGEALAIADRVAVLNKGIVEQLDVPQVIYQKPATEFVARFVGTATELEIGGCKTFIRPEDLKLEADPHGAFTVTGHSYTGERTTIRAAGNTRATEGIELVSSAFLAEAQGLPAGARVRWRLSGEPAFTAEGSAA